MAGKSFFEIFCKYIPTNAERTVLNKAADFKVLSDKESRKVQIIIKFNELVEKDILHTIEKKIAEIYNLAEVSFLTKYEKDMFSKEYFEQIIIEAKKYTANTFFLTDSTLEFIGDGNNNIAVNLAHGGRNYLESAANFFELVKKIIHSEFELFVDIEICGVTELFIGDEPDIQNKTQKYIEFEEENERYIENHPVEPESESGSGSASNGKSGGMNNKRRSKGVPIPPKPVTGDDSAMQPKTNSLDGENIYIHDKEKNKLTLGYLDIDLNDKINIFGNADEIFDEDIKPISSVSTYGSGEFVITAGKIFAIEKKEIRKANKTSLTIKITNYNASIIVKMLNKDEDLKNLTANLKENDCVIISGEIVYDRFLEENVISLDSAIKVQELLKIDTAEKKRVELHLHTNMSSMDANIKPGDIVKYASSIGHRAVALTDHGNVQGYPEAMLAKEKLEKEEKEFKVIYGIEAYLTDDSDNSVFGSVDAKFEEDTFVIFDIETTGLSPANSAITEIGAVKIKGGEILEEFNTFVDPEMPIPANITELTGITDEMVKGAKKIDAALKEFLAFAGNHMLIAHNAAFDIGFIKKYSADCKYIFNNPYLDTLAISRNINKYLKNHRLETLVKHYKIKDFHHHRACDDARALAQIFMCMAEQLKSFGITTVFEMNESSNPNAKQAYHIILLVQNNVGLKNLYKLISASFLEHFHKRPRMPKTLLSQYREGLIIGSACEAGALYSAAIEGVNDVKMKEIAEFYDYFEIQPLCNNMFLVNNGTLPNEEAIQNLNRKIIDLGDEVGKPVVATGDVHFMHKYNEIARKILLKGMKFQDADRDIHLYYRTTEEMLEEFSYLSEEKAYEVVVENTNKIADMIEDIRPIPKGAYKPKMDGAEDRLRDMCYNKAVSMYKSPLPEIVQTRLDKELGSIIKHGFAPLYVIAVDLIQKSEQEGYLVGSRGSVGSSFVATLAGITEVNPLPPHYYCTNPECAYSEFIADGTVGSGYDLEDKNCPKCDKKLYQDGQDIPFETFLGFNGEKEPDIDLNFSGYVQATAHKYTEVLFGKENIFRAGTIGALADKTAFGFVKKYLEDKKINLNSGHTDWLVKNCVGVRRTTGQHPGGIIVVPREYEIYDFTPVQHPADDKNSGVVTTHFAFEFLHDTILKLDLLGHDVPTKYRVLKDMTGIDVRDLPMNDKNVMELFASTKSIGVEPADIYSDLGTYGLPEMGTKFVRQMLVDAKPKVFADLLQISGLSHGTDVWLGNAQELIKNNICTISEVIGTRDSIMIYLIYKGLPSTDAFKITESVRKGFGLTAAQEKIMRENNVPDWYIDSCKKIKYMFPKAHAAAYIIAAMRLGWFKVYKPLEFYASYFSVQPEGFDAELAMSGKAKICTYIDEIDAKGNEATQKEGDTVTAMLLVLEMYARGLKLLPVDIYKSAAFEYKIEDGMIRLPFSSLNGVGENAAENIANYRDNAGGEIFSIADIKANAKLTKTVVSTLRRNKVFGNIPETDQMSLF